MTALSGIPRKIVTSSIHQANFKTQLIYQPQEQISSYIHKNTGDLQAEEEDIDKGTGLDWLAVRIGAEARISGSVTFDNDHG